MVSKGVRVHSWISIQGWRVAFSVPKGGVTHGQIGTWEVDHLEVDSSNIEGWFNYTGAFSFTVLDPGGDVVLSKLNNINSMTGNLEGGDMTNIPNMQSMVRGDCIVTVSPALLIA